MTACDYIPVLLAVQEVPGGVSEPGDYVAHL